MRRLYRLHQRPAPTLAFLLAAAVLLAACAQSTAKPGLSVRTLPPAANEGVLFGQL